MTSDAPMRRREATQSREVAQGSDLANACVNEEKTGARQLSMPLRARARPRVRGEVDWRYSRERGVYRASGNPHETGLRSGFTYF